MRQKRNNFFIEKPSLKLKKILMMNIMTIIDWEVNGFDLWNGLCGKP
jgi:hypothetical protein